MLLKSICLDFPGYTARSEIIPKYMHLLSKGPEADFISSQSVSIYQAEPHMTKGQKVGLQKRGGPLLCSRRAFGLFGDKHALINTLTRVNRVKPDLLLFRWPRWKKQFT